MLALFALVGCTWAQPEVAEYWGRPRPSQQVRYTVAMAFEPDSPELGALFAATAIVTSRDGEPVDDAKVTLGARMPQHEHGMETRPIARPGVCPEDGARCRFAEGRYTADGFKFHMTGAWAVTVDIDGPNGRDNASFTYTVR